MNSTHLRPCPFCGQPAESDHHRHFVNYKGVRGTAVAIYCSQCNADMTMCYFDFPQHTPEELMAILTDQWNTREIAPDEHSLRIMRKLADAWQQQSDKIAPTVDLRLATSTDYQAGRRDGMVSALVQCIKELHGCALKISIQHDGDAGKHSANTRGV